MEPNLLPIQTMIDTSTDESEYKQVSEAQPSKSDEKIIEDISEQKYLIESNTLATNL